MTEELNTTTEVVEDNSTDNYIQNIQALQANTVSKDEYNKLVESNKKLADALARGEYTMSTVADPDIDISELERSVKHCKGQTDLAFLTNVLKLRQARLDNNPEDDIFVPATREANDYVNAQAFAEQLQSAIEESNGDPLVFASKIRK